jgi:hypothetical protein
LLRTSPAPGVVAAAGVPLAGNDAARVAAAQQAEASISDFVTRADDLPGPQVDDLADQVSALVEQTRDQIRALLDGVPHNKVLAVQLALGQRARTPATEDQWPLHAASTLMSGFVIGGATSGRP